MTVMAPSKIFGREWFRLTTLVMFVTPLAMQAQPGWRVKGYGLGYKVFEIDLKGNNLSSVEPYVKNRDAYQQLVGPVLASSNSFWGDPGVGHLKTVYANVELQKKDPQTRFAKQFSVQAGLLLTTTSRRPTGRAGFVSSYANVDTPITSNTLALVNHQQLAGANIGLNWRAKILRHLNFVTGLHVQGSFTIKGYYAPSFDSSVYRPATGWITKSVAQPKIDATQYFQWQAMIPLGLELELYKQQLLLRAEAYLGWLGDRYRTTRYDREAHGIGFWLIYQPRRR